MKYGYGFAIFFLCCVVYLLGLVVYLGEDRNDWRDSSRALELRVAEKEREIVLMERELFRCKAGK